MNGEFTWRDRDIQWLNNECKSVGLGSQNKETCDMFAENVETQYRAIKDIELAKLVVFSDLMGIK